MLLPATVAAGGGYIEVGFSTPPFTGAGCDFSKVWRYTPASSPVDCDGLTDEVLVNLSDTGEFPLDGALTATISSA